MIPKNFRIDDQVAAAEVAEAIVHGGGTAISLPCDVTREEDLARLVNDTAAKFGKLTILVSNAGGGGPKPFDMPMATVSGGGVQELDRGTPDMTNAHEPQP